MEKEKIIELLKNESVNDVLSIDIVEDIRETKGKIAIFYNDKKGLPGSITQTF